MAVVIRLRQEGSKDHTVYRIVAADKRARRDGRFLEILGTYDPNKDGKNYSLNMDRINSLISEGAKPSGTVASLIRKSVAAAG
ncbi:MAG: 30S ribosomal protein S16 [Verrucomicrobiales bacterium]|nr:30S ribosomal protein S16 [Verrucomicrobiales bacterium]MCP5557005.1 30S ribosomal protein S16 [Verrucomicrobiaceae bacterium]